MYQYKQFKKSIWLERKLGSPFNPNNDIAFEKTLDLDEKSDFPIQQEKLLTSLGINRYFVPASLGGDLSTFDEMANLFRSIFRRDVTLGVGYGATTLMACSPVFLGGTDSLKRQVANIILSGSKISICYHEKEHGNDILSNEVKSEFHNEFYWISGTKWLINNLIPSQAITTFVRTNKEGGVRGFSLFLIEKDKLSSQALIYSSKIKTHGVKGCQIASVTFNNALVHPASMIGKAGDGFELTLKAFQITRSVLPSMAIGAGDTALRCAISYSMERELYGQKISKIPHVKEILVDSFIDLLVSDCLSIAATRGLHVIPEQMSINSAITKFLIPKIIEKSLKNLAIIMGSRFYIRDGKYGIFQKILRDFSIVSLGHSSDVICLNSILSQFKFLFRRHNNLHEHSVKLQSIFSLDHDLPVFNPLHLKMCNTRCNDIIQAFPYIISWIKEGASSTKFCKKIADILIKYINVCVFELNKLEHKSNSFYYQLTTFSSSQYLFAELYSQLFAIACCFLTWIHNFSKISSFFDQGIWLVLSVHRVLKKSRLQNLISHNELTSITFDYVNFLHSKNMSFSIFPIQYEG